MLRQYTVVSELLARTHDLPRLVYASANWERAAGSLPPVRSWTDPSAGAPVVTHRSSWVRRLTTDAGEFYVKCYEYRGWKDRTRNWAKWTAPWRPSRPARECAAYSWLRSHGFLAPAHFACLEQRHCGFLTRAFVITSSLGGLSAERFLAQASRCEREAAARLIGRFVRALHTAGFRDRNLDLRNLIVDGDQVAKIDSPRHRVLKPGPATDSLARADWSRLLPQLATFDAAETAQREA